MWKKLVTPTITVSLLWLVVGGATIYYLDWVYRSHSRDRTENFTTIQATDAMQDVLWRLQATVIEVTQRADSHTRIEIAELEDAFEEQLANADAGCTNLEAKGMVAAIREQFFIYRRDIHRRIDPEVSKEPQDLPAMELSHSAHAIAESCKSLLKIQEQLIAESTAQRSRLRAAFGNIMLVLWIVGPAMGVAWGIWVARWLRRSISQINISLKDAAGGLEREVDRVDLLPSDDLPVLQDQIQLVSSRIKQVVDDLQQARRETMLADRLAAVGEMAAGVAHELRNPLTSVKLLIQTALDCLDDRTVLEEHVHIVLEQVTRMENTIQGLLDFARPPQMQQVRHDLRDTLQRAINLTEGHARQQGVNVQQERPSTPVLVDGDPEQLHQVFVNLLLNGVEAMPEGGELQVILQKPTTEGRTCRVLFSDTGGGIPEAIMQRIFEPFVTSKQRGTGLGLAISRRIIEQHGGRLSAANRAGIGALFTVELPLSESPADGTTPWKHNGSKHRSR